MKGQTMISRATIDRLPLYFRTLKIALEEGAEIISSEELGRRLGVTPEQIRKDLATFGEFGKKGVGYFVRELMHNIVEILGLNNHWNIAIIGLGHLGGALANYNNFISLGFRLAAIFDVDSTKVGQCINGATVYHIERLEEIVKERNIHIGIITVPVAHAQKVADRLVAAGIRGIWNFAPIRINVPDDVKVISEDLSVGLSSISFYISHDGNN